MTQQTLSREQTPDAADQQPANQEITLEQVWDQLQQVPSYVDTQIAHCRGFLESTASQGA